MLAGCEFSLTSRFKIRKYPVTWTPSFFLQVSRWSKSSAVVWLSSNSERRPKLSVSGMRSTVLRPTSWPRPHRHPPTPPSCPTALRWVTAPSDPHLWFTTPSCTTTRRRLESSRTTRSVWRARTAWTPACPRETTRPARQTTCPGMMKSKAKTDYFTIVQSVLVKYLCTTLQNGSIKWFYHFLYP